MKYRWNPGMTMLTVDSEELEPNHPYYNPEFVEILAQAHAERQAWVDKMSQTTTKEPSK